MARDIEKLNWNRDVIRNNVPGYHGDGGGLWLRIGPTGAKSWVFRYRIEGGKQREMGLGPIHTINLAEAREKALTCRKMRLEGRDPIEERAGAKLTVRLEAAKAITFRTAAERYVESKQAEWRNPRNREQWLGTLAAYAYPVLGDLPVQAIDTPLVLKVLEPAWKKTPETASRVRQRIEAVLDAATARGERQGENPARWRGHLDKLLPRKSKVKPTVHHEALPYGEVAGFMTALRGQPGVAAGALEFAILTAARSGEVLGARWEEFNLKERVWVVPAERMKSGKEHRVPLSDRAVAILAEMEAAFPVRKHQAPLVFPGRSGRLSHDAMRRMCERVHGGLTVHGFRASFAQWAAERTAYVHEIRELALAHTVGSAVERAYQRSDLFDRRRRLMDDWARWCAGEGAGGEVVPLRAGQ